MNNPSLSKRAAVQRCNLENQICSLRLFESVICEKLSVHVHHVVYLPKGCSCQCTLVFYRKVVRLEIEKNARVVCYMKSPVSSTGKHFTFTILLLPLRNVALVCLQLCWTQRWHHINETHVTHAYLEFMF